MVLWKYDNIGRNIVVFISFSDEIIEIEYNAWLDTTEVEKEKLVKFRNWYHKKIHTFPIPESYKLTQNFRRKYDLKLSTAINKVNNLTFKDLKKEAVYYIS